MPDFGSALGDQPGLDEVARTDLLLDALADRQPVDTDDAHEEALAILMQDWRDDLRWPPSSALVSPEEAVEALRTGLAGRRRNRRGLAAIGSVAASLLLLSGFGAVMVEARPGDALYGLHAMFFDQPRVNDDQIVLSAKAELAKIQQLIDEGQWDQAHDQLAEVRSAVQSMTDGDSRKDLLDEVNLLDVRVKVRDPNATLPRISAVEPTPAPAAPAPLPAVVPTPAPAAVPSPAPAAVPPPAPAAPALPPPPPSGRHHHHHQHTLPAG